MTITVWDLLVQAYDLQGAEKSLAFKEYQSGGEIAVHNLLISLRSPDALKYQRAEFEAFVDERITVAKLLGGEKRTHISNALRSFRWIGRKNREGD